MKQCALIMCGLIAARRLIALVETRALTLMSDMPALNSRPFRRKTLCIFRSIETRSRRALRRQGGGSPLVNKGDFLQISPVTPLFFKDLEFQTVEKFCECYQISLFFGDNFR